MSKAEQDYLRSQTDSKVTSSDKSNILCFAQDSDLDSAWVQQEIKKNKSKAYQEKQTLDTQESQRTVQGDAGEDLDRTLKMIFLPLVLILQSLIRILSGKGEESLLFRQKSCVILFRCVSGM